MKVHLTSFTLGGLALFLLAVLVTLLAILTGSYNVAATKRHSTVVAWALETSFRDSVQDRADGVAAPRLTQAMVDAGAPEYKSMCAHCHGGVGERRAAWADGMLPSPPALARTANQWSAAEVFWLVKHGAKSTGMPAFGGTHDDTTLWNIAAFVKALPTMPAERYAAYSSRHGRGSEEGEDDHSHASRTPAHED